MENCVGSGLCEPLIDAKQAGMLLGIHPKTVKQMAAEGKLPGMKIGSVWRFRASKLDEWVKAQLDCHRHSLPNGKERYEK